MADLSIQVGQVARDFAAERFADDSGNRGEVDAANPLFQARCAEALVRGLRLMSHFPDLAEASRSDGRPSFLETPRFNYPGTGLNPEQPKTIGEVSIEGVLYASRDLTEILAEEAFDDLDLDPDKTRWTMYTHPLGGAKGNPLFRVTAGDITRFDATGQGLSGYYPELFYLNMVMGGMEAAAYPQ